MPDLNATELWRRLERWAEAWSLTRARVSARWRNLPGSFRPLVRDGSVDRPLTEPPATDEDEDDLATSTGLQIPADLRALHAVHDGSYAPLLPYGARFLSYQAILGTWKQFAALADQHSEKHKRTAHPSGTHRVCAQHRSWLPIAVTDDTSVVLDFAPGPAGVAGQVLFDVGECNYVVVARSTTDFLFRWLQLLDEGSVAYSPQYQYAVPVGEEPIEKLLQRTLDGFSSE